MTADKKREAKNPRISLLFFNFGKLRLPVNNFNLPVNLHAISTIKRFTQFNT